MKSPPLKTEKGKKRYLNKKDLHANEANVGKNPARDAR